MSSRARLLAVLPLLLLLGWLGMTAHRKGRANALAADASSEMVAWRRATPSPGTWEWLRQDLEQAAAMDASNPSISELRGQLSATRTGNTEYLKEAVEHFRQAVRERPSSPYAWASLLENTYRLGGNATELEPMIQRAVALGPHEPAVQRNVADFGLAVWNDLSLAGRTATERAVASAMRRNPLEMLRIAERRGRLNLACRHIAQAQRTRTNQWSKFCPRTEATQ